MSKAALFDALAPEVITNEMRRACLERELAYRKRVYPRLILKKVMSQAAADREIQVLTAILSTGYRP